MGQKKYKKKKHNIAQNKSFAQNETGDFMFL